MRIAQIAPFEESVPPKKYGGTERVVSWLTEELIRLGHEVTLFASGDSKTSAELVPICEQAARLDELCTEPFYYWPLLIEKVIQRMGQFDIIHGHVDGMLLPQLRRVNVASVHTLHGRLDLPEVSRLFAEFREMPLISISNSQRKPLAWANWCATIYHGMPKTEFTPVFQASDYFLFLGRMSPEKGPDIAIEASRRAGVRLLMAAKVDTKDKAYFAAEVKPRLSLDGVEFLGEVCGKEKEELLSKARALLFPIKWPEPFGLVMIEALACGTPVIAFNCGSAPEVIDHEKTGFCCTTLDEFIEAIKSIHLIDRRACRNAFEQRFTDSIMTQSYIDVYERIINSHASNVSVMSFVRLDDTA